MKTSRKSVSDHTRVTDGADILLAEGANGLCVCLPQDAAKAELVHVGDVMETGQIQSVSLAMVVMMQWAGESRVQGAAPLHWHHCSGCFTLQETEARVSGCAGAGSSSVPAPQQETPRPQPHGWAIPCPPPAAPGHVPHTAYHHCCECTLWGPGCLSQAGLGKHGNGCRDGH